MKKTVGIMTSEESFLNNYGAVLQGYALQNVICKMGYDAKIIRYNGYGPTRRFGWAKDIIKKLLGIKRGVISHEEKVRKARIEKVVQSHKAEIDNRTGYFKRFQDDTMQFYSDERMTWDKLQKCPPQFDMYVCGSDQIWNPVFHGGICDRGYFLDFVPEGRKRIAYAPSLGVDVLPDSCKVEMKALLNKMSAVSIRETRGGVLLSELMGRKIDSVLDPTLLLAKKDWLEVARLPEGMPEKYMLCYRFSDNTETLATIQKISKKTGLPVVSLPLSAISMEDPFINVYQVGPREFIGLINGAELVCTDSFHATVFSFLTDTPFLTFMREQYSKNGASSMNSRVVNLLETVELTDRIVVKEEDIDYGKIFTVDYTKGKKHITELREISLDYLKNALEK